MTNTPGAATLEQNTGVDQEESHDVTVGVHRADITRALALLLCALLVATPALGYHTDDREGDLDCIDCHGDDRDPWTGQGPHGYYTMSTEKCSLCHMVHAQEATASILLLPAPTITGSCLTCHDSTGALGVYSAIQARGGSVAASHSVETTNVVPGGSTPLGFLLGCSSCHSVHAATQMQPFLRDTGKAFASKQWIYSNCLLRDDVGGSVPGTFTEYGAAWCAGCHDERTDWGAVHNHPVSKTATYTLGRSNDGYTDDAEAPYCMQCHEDFRDVETTFSASMKDYGYPAPDAPTNPEFTSFPHQTEGRYMRVENADDLCLNCHDLVELP